MELPTFDTKKRSRSTDDGGAAPERPRWRHAALVTTLVAGAILAAVAHGALRCWVGGGSSASGQQDEQGCPHGGLRPSHSFKKDSIDAQKSVYRVCGVAGQVEFGSFASVGKALAQKKT